MSFPRSCLRRFAAVLPPCALALAMAATLAEAEPATPRPVTTTTSTTMSAAPSGATAPPATTATTATAATTASTTPVARRRPDPLDPAAPVPVATHHALLPTTGPADDPAVADWRDANDVVARTGGWRALAGDAEEGAPR